MFFESLYFYSVLKISLVRHEIHIPDVRFSDLYFFESLITRVPRKTPKMIFYAKYISPFTTLLESLFVTYI